MSVVDAPHHVAPFALHHEPVRAGATYTLSGHVHPGYVVTGPARQQERLSCFIIGERGAVLPAFGSFTGTVAVDADVGDRVFVIADDAVIAIGPRYRRP